MHEAFFIPDGDRFVSTEYTRGPWDDASQHFGPPAALLLRACERLGHGMHAARVTTEILRPVPIAPLEVTATVRKPGDRVRVVEATLAADGRELAWSRALLVRTTEQDMPDEISPPGPPTPREQAIPEELPFVRVDGTTAIFEAVDVRLTEGTTARPGPATAWFRLLVPLVAGETTTGPQLAAVVSDFGNGLSWVLDWHRWLFVNADLSLHLHRPPVGDWLSIDARTMSTGNGIGLAEAALSDERGRVGRSLQDLFIDELRG